MAYTHGSNFIPGGSLGPLESVMKTANNCFQARTADIKPQWFVVDAKGKVLGRLASRIAGVLMGKHKPTYTPHLDTGDFVIVLNAGEVKVTGKKKEQVIYMRYSGYPGGHKEETMQTVLDRHPERVVEMAVKRMMPKSALSKQMLKKLKVYAGSEHPHQAQQPAPLPV